MILDEDHTGLDDVKDRILEYLAVRKLRAERGLGVKQVSVYPDNRARGHPTLYATYILMDGCHACKRVGEVMMGLRFDAEGRYIGAQILRVRPIVR